MSIGTAAGDEGEKLLYILGRRWREWSEAQRAIGSGNEETVGKNRMDVNVEIEGRAHPLNPTDRPRFSVEEPDLPPAFPLPREESLQEALEHGEEQRRIGGNARAQARQCSLSHDVHPSPLRRSAMLDGSSSSGTRLHEYSTLDDAMVWAIADGDVLTLRQERERPHAERRIQTDSTMARHGSRSFKKRRPEVAIPRQLVSGSSR